MSNELFEIPRPRHNRPQNVAAMAAATMALGRIGTREDADTVLIERERLHPRGDNPRHSIGEEKYQKKRAEIRGDEQLHDFLVEPMPGRDGHYRIIDGELRWGATYGGDDWVGWPEVRCTVKEGVAAADAVIMAAKSNDDAEPLNDYDWCYTVTDLHETHAISLSEINRIFQKDRNWASKHFSVLRGIGNQSESVKKDLLKLLQEPETFSKIEEIVKLPTPYLVRTWTTNLMQSAAKTTVEKIKQAGVDWKADNAPKDATDTTADATPAAPPNAPQSEQDAPQSAHEDGCYSSRTVIDGIAPVAAQRTVEFAPPVHQTAVPPMTQNIRTSARAMESVARHFHESGTWAAEIRNEMARNIQSAIDDLTIAKKLLEPMGE